MAGIVWGGHARRPPPAPWLHADRRELGRGAAGARRTRTGRSRPTWGAGPWERELDRLDALAPAAVRARPATRWAAASRSRSRCGAPSACARSCSSPRRPGSPTPAERAARRAADEALAERIEAIGAEAFAREWAAQPLFAGQPAAVAALAHEDRLRRTAAEHAAQLRGLGTGVMPPLWDRLGELAMPVTLVVGERDAKFRALAERMAERLPDGEIVVVAGAGHAVALEAPEAVAEAIARTHPAVP